MLHVRPTHPDRGFRRSQLIDRCTSDASMSCTSAVIHLHQASSLTRPNTSSACPYSLSGTGCGHSFCALCLLRWAFTKLNIDLGTWDAPLACPLCTVESSAVPIHLPRPTSPFPFQPNRTLDAVLGAMVKNIACALDGNARSGSQGDTALDPIPVEDENVESGDVAQVSGWKVDGALRKEWDLRERCVSYRWLQTIHADVRAQLGVGEPS